MSIPPSIMKAPGGRTQWELSYVSEFAAHFYPDDRILTYVRLGKDPRLGRQEEWTEEEAQLLRVELRWADAVIIRPKEILLIEGKLRPAEYPEGIAKLELYTPMLKNTQEFRDLMPRKVQGILVIPIEDPVVVANGREKGIRVIIWKPRWYQVFVNNLSYRARRPARYE